MRASLLLSKASSFSQWDFTNCLTIGYQELVNAHNSLAFVLRNSVNFAAKYAMLIQL